MKKIVLFMFVVTILMLVNCSKPTGPDQPDDDNHNIEITFPRIIAYWQCPGMLGSQADELGQFGVVVVDMENAINNRDQIEELKSSGIKIYGYFNPQELFVPAVAGRSWQTSLLDSVESRYVGWWLKDVFGNHIEYWDGMEMMNLSSQCPVINDRQWTDFLAEQIIGYFLQDDLFNGLIVDNCWDDVSWLAFQLDVNNDGIVDNPDGWQPGLEVDQWWREGVEHLLDLLIQGTPAGFVLIGNEGNPYFLDKLSGKLIEDFPRPELGGWSGSTARYLDVIEQTGSNESIIMTTADAAPEKRLFVLCSTLLGNGYFCAGINNATWYPEFDIQLGKELGDAEELINGIWQRDFEHGIVLCNPTSRVDSVCLDSVWIVVGSEEGKIITD